jgi:ATP-dependent Clp protease ATP-binding subunit ClpA
VSDEARAWLAARGHDPLMGARPLARLIQDRILRPLGDEILFGRLEDGGSVAVGVTDGELGLHYGANVDEGNGGREPA